MMFVVILCFLVSFPVVVFLYQYIVHEHVLKINIRVCHGISIANDTARLRQLC